MTTDRLNLKVVSYFFDSTSIYLLRGAATCMLS